MKALKEKEKKKVFQNMAINFVPNKQIANWIYK